MAAEPYPRIETQRLVLSLPPPSEASSFVAFYRRNQERLKPWDPDRGSSFYTETFWRRQLHLNRRDYEEDRALRLALHLPGRPDHLVGVANFTTIIRGCFQSCVLGYTLDEEAEGQGLMREALEASLAYVFEELGLHRVMANYQPTNERSGALLRRLGFQTEGYARDFLWINGAWRDHILTSLVAPETSLQPAQPAVRKNGVHEDVGQDSPAPAVEIQKPGDPAATGLR